MDRPIRPPALRRGDLVAVVSPSWGGPSIFPGPYDRGLQVLREDLGLRVREMPSVRAHASWLQENPRARADDLHAAFEDAEVRAIIASIGGDDGIRVLPYLHPELVRRNPKIVMGYSDTTALLVWTTMNGLTSFHGPSVMAGLAQARALPESFLGHVRAMLFEAPGAYAYAPYGVFAEGYPDWSTSTDPGAIHRLRGDAEGWRFLRGQGRATGRLFGGCLEVIDLLRGTQFWPGPDFFEDVVLFVETSEEKPPPRAMRRTLRSLAVAGVLGRLSGLLVGRPMKYSDEEKAALDREVLAALDEAGLGDLPVVTNVDFGHTDPQLILPLGGLLEIDVEARNLRLTEQALVQR